MIVFYAVKCIFCAQINTTLWFHNFLKCSCDTDSKAVSLLMKRFGWTYARVMIDDPKQMKYVDKLRDNGAGLGICIGNPLEVYGSTTQSSLMDNLKGTPGAYVTNCGSNCDTI